MNARQAEIKTARGARRERSTDAFLNVLLVVNLLLFAGGAFAHSGIPIPLGPTTWREPSIVPAAIIEGLGAAGLLTVLIAVILRRTWAYRTSRWVLWYCFTGVLWGMVRLAMGSIPAAHTVSNDFLHIGMTLVTTLSLVRLAKVRA